MKNLKENDQQKNARSLSVTRRDFLSTSLKVGAATFTTGLFPNLRSSAKGKYNVLFIVVDDLRPMLGCYGVAEMHTPNIDNLAARGTQFNRAYCQYPLCNPSRASILTGLRPETTKVHNNSADYKNTVPDAVDIYQHFMNNGYNTHTIGKVKHYPSPSTGGPTWKALDVSDDDLSDGETARNTVEFLSKNKDQPFFLAVGFDKPHLPFNAPKKYFDLYTPNRFLLPTTFDYPTNSPSIAHNSLDSFRRYFSDIPSGDEPISDVTTLELIRAYAASTSYMDAQVGRVIEQLDLLGLNENTVIVFCGDHGFHLGEHGTWRKNTLYEVSLLSPLLISMPGQQPCQTEALSELIDIYPTLCDACDIPIPTHLEGLSLLPVIQEPTKPWKTAAYSFIKRAGTKAASIRTDRYRYTEWGSYAKFGHELYDYQNDLDETINIADLPENAQLVEHLRNNLHAGWKAGLPNESSQVSIPNTLLWDINNDGIVNIQDLIIVSNNFGKVNKEFPKADVNKDGIVDIIDLLYVATHFGEFCVASAPALFNISDKHVDNITAWITDAYKVDDGSDLFNKGITSLESLLNQGITENTTLYQNYPNPFNPETWIPYDLTRDTDVDIRIYNLKGEVVKKLDIGFQNAGSYRNKESAAYWDGCNAIGERVASGTYYYTLKTNHFNATRKMTILK